jgi:hypothetical protein
VVIVGERKDSQTYVRMKRKACAEVGIKSVDVNLAGDSAEEEILKKVLELNSDPEVHGKLHRLSLLVISQFCNNQFIGSSAITLGPVSPLSRFWLQMQLLCIVRIY